MVRLPPTVHHEVQQVQLGFTALISIKLPYRTAGHLQGHNG
jgi:hypothetical protein